MSRLNFFLFQKWFYFLNKIFFLKKKTNVKVLSKINTKFCWNWNSFNILFFFAFFSRSEFVLRSETSFFWNGVKNGFSIFFVAFRFFKFWVLPLVVFCVFYLFLYLIKSFSFNKIFFGWVLGYMFTYWLLSGFVFFFKKYQFGKYTTAIQRFWRRSYILFWLIEGCLFIVFLYLVFNASAESFFFFDASSIYKTHMYSFRFFLYKLSFSLFLILVTYLVLLRLKNGTFYNNLLIFLVITIVLTYIIWLEFYQIYHVIGYYSFYSWIYDTSDNVWVFEADRRKTRVLNNYVSLVFLLKFWHIVFIYAFWLFYLIRSAEVKTFRYSFLSVNLQNFLILYIFNWVTMFPWIKFHFRNFLLFAYKNFYVNFYFNVSSQFTNDLFLIQ